MILSSSDFQTSGFIWSIPKLPAEAGTGRIDALIPISEFEFEKLTEKNENDILQNKNLQDALKCFFYCKWLNIEFTRKTQSGSAAKNRYNQSDTEIDYGRIVDVWNYMCDLLLIENINIKKLTNLYNY